MQYTQQTRQINLDISNVIQTSHFCNKLWNLFKFGLGRLEAQPELQFDSQDILSFPDQKLSLANRYILSRMADTITKCHAGFESSRLFEATDALRRFVVEDVCDIYVEFSKSALSRSDPEEKVTDISKGVPTIIFLLIRPFCLPNRTQHCVFCMHAWIYLYVWLIR